MAKRDHMQIVIVGHVDHGKSTVIGRLLADTDSLPKGKLEQVKAMCERHARPFEYAFLLDALKDEQAQGITIDTARCFFKTKKRDYIVLDAPGHIEFLKNMVTGAARAEAALLVIDAHEGIKENSRRHGYLVSMLGINQVTVLVNKMDLVNYSQSVFETIRDEYTEFLKHVHVKPVSFIPMSAMQGENLTEQSEKMSWYKGKYVLEQLDAFEKKGAVDTLPFRFPVQDIYKFTAQNDERRIVAGTIETGSIRVGDAVRFLPSGKETTILSIEAFNVPPKTRAFPGEAVGFTLSEQIYIRPGEVMVRKVEPAPLTSSRFKANVFWMGKAPLIPGKKYKLKLGTSRVSVMLTQLISVLDASELEASHVKKQVDRHDVAECIFETAKPVTFDPVSRIESMGRFVIVDHYEIAGGGIISEAVSDQDSLVKEHVRARELAWDKSSISLEERVARYKHHAKFVLITGKRGTGKRRLAKALERELFRDNFHVYYLGVSSLTQGIGSEALDDAFERESQVARLGELARIMTESGFIFITTISEMDDDDLKKLKLLNEPFEIMVFNVGSNEFISFEVDGVIDTMLSVEEGVSLMINKLREKEIFLDFQI